MELDYDKALAAKNAELIDLLQGALAPDLLHLHAPEWLAKVGAAISSDLVTTTAGSGDSLPPLPAMAYTYGDKIAGPMGAARTPVQAVGSGDALDAKRYRWLRECDWFSSEICALRNPKEVLTRGSGIGADCPSRDRLDAIIDAALSKAGGAP